MLKYLTGVDIANEVIMSRSAFSGTFLLVEGEGDFLCFARFVDGRKCKIIPAHGKPNVIEAVESLEQRAFEGFLAIVDADFWHIDGVHNPSKNLLTTDFHDLELMIVNSRAFQALLAEYSSSSKIKTFLTKHSSDNLRLILLSLCLPVGLLRWISVRENLSLKFEGLDYDKLVDKDSLSVNIPKLIRNVLSLTSKKGLKVRVIHSKLTNALAGGPYDLLQMCCGHDFTAIISIGLRKALGSINVKIANRENIEKMLRLSYDSRDFERTSLHEASKKWKSANVPYEVFAL